MAAGSTAATTIDPEQIRKELADLWVSMAKENKGESGVLRARSMTLIAAMREEDDPGQVGETVAMLMREHPSRAIVVRVRDTQEQFLASKVFAQCWMPFGDRRQICCEQVEITASCSSLSELPAVILPLTVADLPVVLWARSAQAIDRMAHLASKVIVDGEILQDFEKLVELSALHRVADLAWTRLTRWRETIAQIFENQCHLKELPSLTKVRITYKGERPSFSGFYLAAWLDREVIWEKGTESSVALETEGGIVYTALRTADETSIDVTVGGKVTRTIFPPASDYTLLREELSIPGKDLIFEGVLPKAASLAAGFKGTA